MVSLPRQYGGKTELGVRLLHDITARPFPSSSLFLAKDTRSGKRATREKFMRVFDKSLFSVNTEQIYLKKCPTSSIFMASIDKDPDRARGGTYGMIHWSEVAFSKIDHGETITGVFDKVINPTLSQRDGYCFLESTNNGKNGWYDLWENAATYGFSTLKVGLSDMVYMGLLDEEEYLRIKNSTHPDVFRQEYDCEWVTFQGKVYEEFTDKLIDKNMKGPESWMITLSGIDWGFFPSATCVLFGYVHNGVLNIFDEHYKTKERPDDTAISINGKLEQWDIFEYASVADHEADRIEELNRRGIICSNANKVNILGARLQIKEMMWAEKIKIHPRCKNLIRDLHACVWDVKKSKDGEIDYSQCSWGHFDAEAALRYMVREFADFERDMPDLNPFKNTDIISSKEWLMRRQLMEDGYGGIAG